MITWLDGIDPKKPRSKQVYEAIRERIEGGQLASGAKLPTELELMQHFNVSRTTISRALRDLELQGFIRRRRGSGTYVKEMADAVEQYDLAFFMPWMESGVALPYVEGLIHQGLADLASRRHSTLLLKCLSGDGSFKERVLNTTRSLIDLRVDGVFYYPAELPGDQMQLNRVVVDMLAEAGISVILIDRDIASFPNRSEFTRIGYDNRRAGVILTEHLIRRGCHRIAFVGIPEISTAVADRLAGYFEAHRMHDMSVDSELVHMVDEYELTRSFCEDLMQSAKPDAIISKMDRFAALIGRHLIEQGLQIGQDVKMAGFDDDPIAELLPVTLTTIRLPIRPFVKAAYEAMLDNLSGSDKSARQIIVDTELVVRSSTDFRSEQTFELAHSTASE
ncbi:GntR family transcriptional regulator [Bythopirellula goksoeyrii]|uniref:Arabinose metabolism transcriptional repressor n=1 Tax=Bythopirellula goksoeyrii TaxID=1400387 RepID=A0A5B9QFJ8_9BACT|nr:GntR family transcriptional regulator [Bythopirellula goksoeyrii]QEG36405.1 Arabinose metabolism transcriptional repressor [Bythopirellula goksoeyrii]